MPMYRVEWKIDIDAETPEEAAREAWDIQHDPDSQADHFTVFEFDAEEGQFIGQSVNVLDNER